MLKNLLVALAIVTLPGFVSAETLLLDLGHDGHTERAVVSYEERAGTVAIFDNGKLLGKFDNLIVDQPALSSGVLALAGGGLAIEIESDGSRNKFHIVAPVIKRAGRLYVDCVYKSVYDSVGKTRSVGSLCGKVELGKFDVSDVVNDDGMKLYRKGYEWLKRMAPTSCANAVGFEYGNYRIARCSMDGVSDTRKQRIVVLDKQGETLLSLVGYELIPQHDGSSFLLSSDLQDQAVVFVGNLTCFVQRKIVPNAFSGKATLVGKFTINYTLGWVGDCLTGHYSYTATGGEIFLMGSKNDALTYLLELGANNVSTGLFVLDRLDDGARGVWIGVPPRPPLAVN
jgi:hypothetical protein